jgi:two-component system chemotaxis response regulator CheY
VYNNEERIMPTTKRILLVDDDETLRTTLRTCLEAVGYQCKEAKDGSDARDWLKEGHSVALIVTDYQMPKVNGLELIEWLKRQVNTESIPIIFYSGQLSHELKVRAIKAGSHAVIEKPFPLQAFLDLVAQACEKSEM